MTALAPVFGVICLGFILRRAGFLDDIFWPQAERMIYYILFPPLLITIVLNDDLIGGQAIRMGSAIFLALLVISGILFLIQPLLKRFLKLDGPAFTSILQGSIRPNTFVGLAATQALLGDQDMAFTAVVILAMVPLVNLISILALTTYGTSKKSGLMPLFSELGKNPLLLSVLAGFAINLSGLSLPNAVLGFLNLMSRAALPLGLLAVGAGLSSKGLKNGISGLGVSLAMKLLALPAVTLLLLHLFGVTGVARDTAIFFTIIPCASSSYILARQLGGDERLMAAIVTIGVVVAAATMPFWLAIL